MTTIKRYVDNIQKGATLRPCTALSLRLVKSHVIGINSFGVIVVLFSTV